MRIVARAQDPPPDPRFRARGAVWLHEIKNIVIYNRISTMNHQMT